MTTEWFECKVSYDKENEEGNMKKITEGYLVDAVSFTEAETVITEEVSKFITGSSDVKAVKKEKISEIFRGGEDSEYPWFKAKVAFITVDEISGKEKRTMVSMYQQSEDMFAVARDLKDNLKTSIVDWEIKAITETKILDVYEHKAPAQD